mmetsp:Transcript_22845/g.33882  ORF Transcript_22845/g.33882 Transcript_22845/m.33882 type:complete len:81 (-) Transcript_22845:577-819(-)
MDPTECRLADLLLRKSLKLLQAYLGITNLCNGLEEGGSQEAPLLLSQMLRSDSDRSTKKLCDVQRSMVFFCSIQSISISV